MNFFISKKDIVGILNDFSAILKDNSVRPILSGIHVTAKNGLLTFKGTNLEVDFIKTIEADIVEEGEVVYKPNLILEYIKLLDIEKIQFNLNENTLYIHQAEFSVLDTDLYPNVSQINGTEITTIKPLILKDIIEKIKFSISTSSDNLSISVIRINFKKTHTDFVGTDSYRLIYLKNNLTSHIERELSIPLDSIASLQKLLKDDDADTIISISFYENYAIFTWKDTYFSTKIIELSYPNYEAIFSNTSFSKTMEFNNSELKSSLKKVLSISKTSQELKFGALFNFKNKKLEMKTNSGKAKITEKVNMLKEGEDFKSSLNAKFILEFVSLISNNVVIKGNDSNSMFEFNELGNDDYRYILMPLAMRS
ncbi:MAG: DNA polymerase III subunit beta [Fusobacteriaceae bacterium]